MITQKKKKAKHFLFKHVWKVYCPQSFKLQTNICCFEWRGKKKQICKLLSHEHSFLSCWSQSSRRVNHALVLDSKVERSGLRGRSCPHVDDGGINNTLQLQKHSKSPWRTEKQKHHRSSSPR